mgnify:CR=1 FL=1
MAPYFETTEISTHALREEGDIRCLQTSERWPSYFYPRPPRGGRPDIVAIIQSHKEISTHALREEGDTDKTCSLHRRCRISTHALREEGDEVLPGDTISCDLFLPTPSARRATASWLRLMTRWRISTHALREEGDRTSSTHWMRMSHFYPRPPRGGRRPDHRRVIHLRAISTHALREEGDADDRQNAGNAGDFYPRPPRGGRPFSGRRSTWSMKFLPTPSARRATRKGRHRLDGRHISTHALREEGDLAEETGLTLQQTNFYPRPPRGGRPALCGSVLSIVAFLPTPSARRATTADAFITAEEAISTHALREEGDFELFLADQRAEQFLPTPSARRATFELLCQLVSASISTHALREEGDAYTPSFLIRSMGISTHALREEGDDSDFVVFNYISNFYPRPPRGGRPDALDGGLAQLLFLPTPSARRATA